MKSAAVLAAVMIGLPLTASAKPGSVFPGIASGQLAKHPCKASYQGKPLFAGTCMVNTKGGETIMFSPTDGCTFTLRSAPVGVTGDLSAYRQTCVLDQVNDRELDDAQALGVMRKAGSCWTGGSALLCVNP